MRWCKPRIGRQLQAPCVLTLPPGFVRKMARDTKKNAQGRFGPALLRRCCVLLACKRGASCSKEPLADAHYQQRVQICGGHMRFTQGRLGGPNTEEGTAPHMPSADMRAARTHPRTCAAHGSRRAMALFRAPQPSVHQARKPMHMSHALPELVSAVQGADDSKQLATYAGLGLAAASFVVTFFVLPQFRDLLKVRCS